MNRDTEDGLDDGINCIDPAVGERVLELETAPESLTQTDRDLLEAHVEACAYCAMVMDLHHGLEEGLRDGSIAAPAAKIVEFPRWRRFGGWSAVACAAACLVCLILLPPTAAGPQLMQRGADDNLLIRPVEGEVVTPGAFEVVWRALPDADAYRLEVGGAGGSTWRSETAGTRLTVPADAGLRRGEKYRILLSAVPEDLLAPGASSVTFRVGNPAEVAVYRVRRAPPVVWALAIAAFGFAVLYLVGGKAGRRDLATVHS